MYQMGMVFSLLYQQLSQGVEPRARSEMPAIVDFTRRWQQAGLCHFQKHRLLCDDVANSSRPDARNKP
ncbi:hypothetical protein V22_36870 [Calycomorphotria hydatis]|uniref:Uncharacterized protein n=1 Tax=Calycomorphotria hydatis TaxID=2528027 RepID=A0A517TDG5_9PLAN|nr:hypothetical protein V22_36870 [Calycomorphotria hydatis]